MSCGLTDMHREEERAAELVEKKCENCNKPAMLGTCNHCMASGFYQFKASEEAIDAKVEELRKEQITTGAKERINKVEGISRFPWTALEMIEKLESERAEMLEVLKSSKEVITDNCRSECDFYNTSDCDLGCATKSMMNSIDRIIKKADGK